MTTDSGASDVYSARGQIEFSKIPSYGEAISITDRLGSTYTFEFTNGGGATGSNIEVDISSATSISDVVSALKTKIDANVRDSGRFVANGTKMDIIQSAAGDALTINAASCLSVLQSQANPDPTTGIATGIYTVQAVDAALKNTARIDFDSMPADTDTITIDGVVFEFTTDGVIDPTSDVAVNISGSDPATAVAALKVAIDSNVNEPNRFVASGRTLNIYPSASGADIEVDATGVTGASGSKTASGTTLSTLNLTGANAITNSFVFNGTSNESGYIVPAVRFNADGTPKYFNVDSVDIEWANGAEDMEPAVKNGQNVDLGIDLFFGNTSTADGLTHLSGNFAPNYITQDGAKFGNFAGVSIGSDGIVTALFDNGETRPVAQIPLATFVNPNGMEARTGNTWIETDNSGQPTVRTAGQGGAGTINSASLEASTVDLGTEFTNMITTQRAYSAAAKVITSADEMLDELVRIKR